jgi:isocitrate dehydrogenase kinase/phosphatase
MREILYQHHRDLLDPAFLAAKQERFSAGVLEDVFPYPEEMRFPR